MTFQIALGKNISYLKQFETKHGITDEQEDEQDNESTDSFQPPARRTHYSQSGPYSLAPPPPPPDQVMMEWTEWVQPPDIGNEGDGNEDDVLRIWRNACVLFMISHPLFH